MNILCIRLVGLIVIFGIIFHLAVEYGNLGIFTGAVNEEYGTLADALYYSFTTYTTVGYGDIALDGQLVFLAAVEAVTGTVLMASSAAIVFIMLQKYLTNHGTKAPSHQSADSSED